MKHIVGNKVSVLLILFVSVLISFQGYAEESGITTQPTYIDSTLVAYPENYNSSHYCVMPGTKVIGKNAFRNNKHLVTICLPEGLLQIENGAFAGCTALQNIMIPDSTMIIGDSAFSYCISLEEVKLPDRLYYLGANAFSETRVGTIVIPESVNFVGDEAFAFTPLSNITFYGVPNYIGYIFTPAQTNTVTVEIAGFEYPAFDYLAFMYQDEIEQGYISLVEANPD